MRIGVICSSGGSAFAEVASVCRHVDFQVVTDRACGAEERCRELAVPCTRLEAKSNREFSERAADHFSKGPTPEVVVLFFARLVTVPLLDRLPILNIHPALLPAFKGMNAVRQARDAGVRFFGATLHLAVPEVDAGPILAQACQPMPDAVELPHLEKLSFLHKVALFLLLIDLLERKELGIRGNQVRPRHGIPGGSRLNPDLRNPAYLEFLQRLQSREGVGFL